MWGVSPLRVVSYLLAPADESSVRALVFRGNTILTLRNRDTTHIGPGGQREVGETIEATLRREVLEETGWTLGVPELLGFMHFHHLGPKPAGHPYRYPDFVQIVFLAEAETHLPDALLPDEYELASGFRPVVEARRLALTLAERLFLDEALRRRGLTGNSG